MRPEEQGGDTIPILAIFDNKCKAIWALPVESKGVNEEAVKWMIDRIDEAGYAGQKVVLKSDQEPAILALKRAVAVSREGEASLIESPVRESKPTGPWSERCERGKGRCEQCAAVLNTGYRNGCRRGTC